MPLSLSTLADSAGLFQFGGGLVTALAGSVVWRRLPHRLIWRFGDEPEIVVCLATSALVDTGAYRRPTTGIGQVKGLATVIPSILTGYGSKAQVATFLSDDIPADTLGKNIVSLGGAKNNKVTRRMIEELHKVSVIRFSDDGNSIVVDGNSLSSRSENGEIVQDWGMILSAKNPFSNDRNRVVILAGASTYGVAAAAKYFTSHRGVFDVPWMRSYWRVISVDVLNGNIASYKHHKTKRF